MKTIQTLLVALICATVHLRKVAAIDLNLLGLATVRIELYPAEGNTSTTIDSTATEAKSDGSQTTPGKDPTEAPEGQNKAGEKLPEVTPSAENPKTEIKPTEQDSNPTEAPDDKNEPEENGSDEPQATPSPNHAKDEQEPPEQDAPKPAEPDATSAPGAIKVTNPENRTEPTPASPAEENEPDEEGLDDSPPSSKPELPSKNQTEKEPSVAPKSASATTPKSPQPAAKNTPKPAEKQQEQEPYPELPADGDDFGDSDVWGDIEDPPEEFGKEDDLDPALLGEDACLDDAFQPKLEMPAPLMRDMFYGPSQDAKDQQQADGPAATGLFGSLISKVTSHLNPSNVLQQLDSIPGTIQSLTDVFRQKKSTAVRSIRERMDTASADVQRKIQEALAGKNACNENAKRCLDELKGSFRGYEKLLQEGIGPCLGHAQRVVQNHEQRVQQGLQQSQEKLQELQKCKANMDNFSIGSMFSAIAQSVKCTTATLQRQITNVVQPLLDSFMNLVNHQGSHLQEKLAESGDCVDARIHQNRFEKLREQLLTKSKQCLTKQ